jgi:hypothetical protein
MMANERNMDKGSMNKDKMEIDDYVEDAYGYDK